MGKHIVGPRTRVLVNGVDLSDHCTTVDVPDETDAVETTGFNSEFREYLPGLRDCTITADFLQDYASGSVADTLDAFQTLSLAGNAGTVKVTPDTSGTVVYTLISKLYNYSKVSGGVGDAHVISGVEFRNAGTAGLTRGTS